MPYKATLTQEQLPVILSPSNMKIGQIGRIIGAPSANYVGLIVLKSYDTLVSLSDPKFVWADIGRFEGASLKIQLLSGAEVTIKGAE
jgi:hypothetical protein